MDAAGISTGRTGLHGLRGDKWEVPAEESHNFNKAKRNSFGGGLTSQAPKPHEGWKLQDCQGVTYDVDIVAEAKKKQENPRFGTWDFNRIRMLGYLLSPTSGPPASKLGLWYSMN